MCAKVPAMPTRTRLERTCRSYTLREGAECPDCEGGGWVMASYQPAPPNFEECPTCGNPERLRCP